MHPAAAPGRGHPRVPASACPQEAREAVLPNEGEARCPLTPSVHPKPVPPLLAAWRGWGEAQRSSPSLLPTAPFQPQPSGPAAAMLRWQRVGRSHPTCGPQGQGQCPPPRRGLPRGAPVDTRQEQQHGNSLQAFLNFGIWASRKKDTISFRTVVSKYEVPRITQGESEKAQISWAPIQIL